MKIEALTEGSLIVELTEEDMKSLNITYEEMDYTNIETRRVIWTILSKARQTLGKDLNTSGSMVVEAMQQGKGGCVLFFTVNDAVKSRSPHRYLIKRQPEYIVFEFACLEDLYSAAKRLGENSGCYTDAELYSFCERYRLLLRPAENPPILKGLLLEYACGRSEHSLIAAQTREAWSLLAENDAVKKLIGEH